MMNEIKHKWLLNPHSLREAYCSSERELSICDVKFTFLNTDNTTVTFRCSADRFLRSPWIYDAGGANATPFDFPRKCSVKGAKLSAREQEPQYVLGLVSLAYISHVLRRAFKCFYVSIELLLECICLS